VCEKDSLSMCVAGVEKIEKEREREGECVCERERERESMCV